MFSEALSFVNPRHNQHLLSRNPQERILYVTYKKPALGADVRQESCVNVWLQLAFNQSKHQSQLNVDTALVPKICDLRFPWPRRFRTTAFFL